MKKLLSMVLALSLMLFVALTACAEDTTPPVSLPDPMPEATNPWDALLAGAKQSVDELTAATGTLSVTGSAAVTAVPDRASISVGVERNRAGRRGGTAQREREGERDPRRGEGAGRPGQQDRHQQLLDLSPVGVFLPQRQVHARGLSGVQYRHHRAGGLLPAGERDRRGGEGRRERDVWHQLRREQPQRAVPRGAEEGRRGREGKGGAARRTPPACGWTSSAK